MLQYQQVPIIRGCVNRFHNVMPALVQRYRIEPFDLFPQMGSTQG